MFIDTNVFVNSRISRAPDHDIARARLERAFQGHEPLRISRQIVREYLLVVTRPQTWPIAITREDALDDVNRLIGSFEYLKTAP
jgi:predicted nucleic acid-binding protein